MKKSAKSKKSLFEKFKKNAINSFGQNIILGGAGTRPTPTTLMITDEEEKPERP